MCFSPSLQIKKKYNGILKNTQTIQNKQTRKTMGMKYRQDKQKANAIWQI